MMRKLRWKFIAITMTIVTLLLTVIFVTLYYSTKAYYRQRSMNILKNAMRENIPGSNPPPPRREETPIMVVDVNPDDSQTVVKNQLLNVGPEEAPGLITLANQQAGSNSGVIQGKHLRFLYDNRRPGGVIRYVFADIYPEQSSLYWQAVHSAIIGVCSFALFFLFSLLLSRWAVKPVEDAWERQRQFVADASHELKTPITVILSNIHLLIQSPDTLTDKSRRRLEHIEAESRRMKQLVESLLTLARSDSGKEAAVHRPLDMSYVVSSSVMTFEPLVYDMGKSISSKVESSLRVNGDEKKLRQLIDILLDNACKYSADASHITVELSGTKTKEALLSVTNQGAPLTKEEIKHIFLRFYRSDPARSQVPGYGLGLSIAENITREHRGFIEAVSDGKDQNTFLVRLPLITI